VACYSNWTSPARLPRVLKRAGAIVEALCPSDRPLTRTRFIDRVHETPPGLNGFVDIMRAWVTGERYDWVLVFDDPLLSRLAELRHEEWLRDLLPIDAEHPWSAALASKAEFCRLAGEAGLPVAESRICTTLNEAYAAQAALGLPLVLKQSSGFAGLGVRAIAELDELAPAFGELAGQPIGEASRGAFSEAVPSGTPASIGEASRGAFSEAVPSGTPASIVAQRFLDGPVGNTVFLFDRGRPICWMSAFKVRTWPGPFGLSSARRFMTHPDVLSLLERVGALTGYHGFGALDWILAGSRLQLIELNARPVPTIHLGPLAGVDFSRAVRELMAGAPSVQAPPDPPRDAPVVPLFPEDLWRSACEHRLPASDWLRRPHDVPWSDPRLLWFHLRRLASGRLPG
jgi:hypothetical protein